jgi:hypothetical protein
MLYANTLFFCFSIKQKQKKQYFLNLIQNLEISPFFKYLPIILFVNNLTKVF